MGPVTASLLGGSRRLLVLLRLPGLVHCAGPVIRAPLKLVLADDDAVALARAGFVERLLNPGHLQHLREPLERLEVVPVGHLHEPLDRGALDVERVGLVDDLEIAELLAVRPPGNYAPPRLRFPRLLLVIDRGKGLERVLRRGHELRDARAVERADDVRVHTASTELPLKLQRFNRRGFRRVNLVQRHNLRFVPNLGVEEEDLVADGVVLVHDVVAGAVQHVHEDPGTLDVPEKLKSEPDALAGALQQTGYVGEDHAGVVALNHAEVGDDGGERVIRDLWLGVAHAGEQRALTRVGHPDDPHVRHQLELHLDPQLGALLAVLGNLRSLVLRRLERRITPTAPAARYDHLPVPVREHLGDDLPGVRVSHDCAGGDQHGAVPRVAPLHPLAPAVPASLRAMVYLLAETHQRVDALVRLEEDGAAVAAVAPVRAALRDESLSSKRHHPAPAVASLDVNLRGVEAPHLGRYPAAACLAVRVRLEVVVAAEVEFHRALRLTGAVLGLDVGVRRGFHRGPALEHVLFVVVRRIPSFGFVAVVVDVGAKVHEPRVFGSDDVEGFLLLPRRRPRLAARGLLLAHVLAELREPVGPSRAEGFLLHGLLRATKVEVLAVPPAEGHLAESRRRRLVRDVAHLQGRVHGEDVGQGGGRVRLDDFLDLDGFRSVVGGEDVEVGARGGGPATAGELGLFSLLLRPAACLGLDGGRLLGAPASGSRANLEGGGATSSAVGTHERHRGRDEREARGEGGRHTC